MRTLDKLWILELLLEGISFSARTVRVSYNILDRVRRLDTAVRSYIWKGPGITMSIDIKMDDTNPAVASILPNEYNGPSILSPLSPVLSPLFLADARIR